MEKIEVIDLSGISLDVDSPTEKDLEQVSRELDKCFSNIGFAYIKNHGVEQKLIEDAFRCSYGFFSLDTETKATQTKGAEYQGWVCQGREIFDQDEEGNVAENELREAYDVKNISLAGKFPDASYPPLRMAITKLADRSLELTRRLLHCLSVALGNNQDYLANIHVGMLSQGTDREVGNATTLRSILYPPIRKEDVKPGNIRCGEHSDYGTITLLFQDDMGGLEVKSCQGTWVPGDPIPGCILINVGDLLENLTCGKYPATRHRVKIPEEELRRNTKRQSMAFFVHPDDAENRFSATYGSKLIMSD